jgi:hypothetical protein
MSTNFYYISSSMVPEDGDHVGQRSGVSGGQTMFFHASPPSETARRLFVDLTKEVVVDEYGRRFTGGQMLQIIAGATFVDTSLIGRTFT